MRKVIQKCICLPILVSGCLLLCMNAKAATYGDDNSWISQAGKDPVMEDGGSVTYETEDKTATSPIWYGTIGFVIKDSTNWARIMKISISMSIILDCRLIIHFLFT